MSAISRRELLARSASGLAIAGSALAAGVGVMAASKKAWGQFVGPSILGAYQRYNGRCTCGKVLENNCAHFLGDALARDGFPGVLNNPALENFLCGLPKAQKRPIRAKELRKWFQGRFRLVFRGGARTRPTANTGFYLAYQERRRDGQGHVLIYNSLAPLPKYAPNRYRGTADFPDWEVQEYYQ